MNVKNLLIEVSFPDRLAALARASGQLYPALLSRQIARVSPLPAVHVVHMKPGYEMEIRRELRGHGLDFVEFLAHGQAFEL